MTEQTGLERALSLLSAQGDLEAVQAAMAGADRDELIVGLVAVVNTLAGLLMEETGVQYDELLRSFTTSGLVEKVRIYSDEQGAHLDLDGLS